MAKKTYKNRKNFIGSEVGLLTKTITVPATTTSVEENGRKIVLAGTVFTTPYYGLLYQDVDITDGANEGSLMVGGYYIDANLPSSASSYVSNFEAQGLFPIVEGSTVRPSFGTVGLTQLSAPTLSVSKASISWSAITSAIGYEVLDANQNYVSSVSGTSYTATATGTYYVRTQGDNINYYSSDLASAVVSSLS